MSQPTEERLKARAKARAIARDLIEKRKKGDLKYKMVSKEEWLQSAENMEGEQSKEALELRKRIIAEMER